MFTVRKSAASDASAVPDAAPPMPRAGHATAVKVAAIERKIYTKHLSYGIIEAVGQVFYVDLPKFKKMFDFP